MIFQNDDDLYRRRRTPWGTILVSAFCVVLALAVVLAIRNRMKRGAEHEGETPPSVAIPPEMVEQPASTPAQTPSAQGTAATPTSGQTAATPATPPSAAPQQTATPQQATAQTPAPRPLDIPSGGLVAERTALMAQLASAPADKRAAIEARLGAVNVAIATTAVPSPGKVEHTVASGDSLGKIAGKYVCPVTLIQTINGLKGTNIRAGSKLIVLDHPKFAMTVSRKTNTLLLTLNGEFFKRYSVCTGADGKTPLGTFEITEKEENPTWYPDGKAPIPPGQPGNILGTRWMRLDATGSTARVRGIGIHGTTDPASIGTSASDGCIRMHNADVEEIFRMIPLNPHVPVTIVD